MVGSGALPSLLRWIIIILPPCMPSALHLASAPAPPQFCVVPSHFVRPRSPHSFGSVPPPPPPTHPVVCTAAAPCLTNERPTACGGGVGAASRRSAPEKTPLPHPTPHLVALFCGQRRACPACSVSQPAPTAQIFCTACSIARPRSTPLSSAGAARRVAACATVPQICKSLIATEAFK